MNESALKWLTERASPPGTVACGLRQPDGNFVCHSVEETCPTATVEKILGHFDNLAAAVMTEPTVPRWCTWVFERSQIRFVERPDGWRFAMVVPTESDASRALDKLSLEFLSLPLDELMAPSAPSP